METPEKYRQYADDCRRLAKTAPAKDKAVLIEIAEAWDRCARDASEKDDKKMDGNADLRNDPPPQSR
jgi:hypothetical protein